MDYRQKTFRKCGSHYSDLGALDGVEVKVGQNFQPPRKVTLPVGFHQNDPSDVLSLTNEIIARSEELKAKKLQEEEEEKEEELRKAAESAANEALAAVPSVSSGQAIFSSVGTDILQPTACTTIGHKRNDSFGKNTIDLSDFEAHDTNPFELVELQTINDLDVLKTVLQSSSQPLLSGETHSVAVASAGGSTTVTNSGFGSTSLTQPSQPSQPFSYLANQTPRVSSTSQPIKTDINSKLSKSVPDLSSNQLVDISSEENTAEVETGNVANSRSVSPPPALTGPSQPNTNPAMGYGIPTQPFSYLHGLQTNSFSSTPVQQHNPVLVDVNSSGPVAPAPLVHSLPPLSATPTSLVCSGQTSYHMAGAGIQPPSNVRLPPLRKPPPIPPRLSGRNRDNNNDIDNLGSSSQGSANRVNASLYPEKTVEVKPVTGTSNQDASRVSGIPPNQSDGELNPSLNHSLIKRQPAQRRNKSSMENSRRHSTPLPPIPNSPGPTTSQSTLPDPTPVLTESEKSFVKYISIMGFPNPRVARAVQRLGEKNREVIDFLVAVEELISQGGFAEDDVEIALTLNDDNDKKALEFLKLSESFKQLGFEESYIQEALKAADNDRDKALDFLTSISAS